MQPLDLLKTSLTNYHFIKKPEQKAEFFNTIFDMVLFEKKLLPLLPKSSLMLLKDFINAEHLDKCTLYLSLHEIEKETIISFVQMIISNDKFDSVNYLTFCKCLPNAEEFLFQASGLHYEDLQGQLKKDFDYCYKDYYSDTCLIPQIASDFLLVKINLILALKEGVISSLIAKINGRRELLFDYWNKKHTDFAKFSELPFDIDFWRTVRLSEVLIFE